MKKVIILIDDDPAIQESARLIFEPEDFDMVIYADAEMIMSGRYTLPNIFIIDKQLPGIDGLEICRHLKRQLSTRHIPVIMISANPNTCRLSLAAGADDFIEKPYSINHMRELVEKFTA